MYKKKLELFGKKLLTGKRIVVTRSLEQAHGLRDALEMQGADVLVLPLIQVSSQYSPQSLKNVFTELAFYKWIIFTSTNGVKYFFALFYKHFHDIRSLSLLKIACIGTATAQAIQSHKLYIDLIPERANSQTLVQALIQTQSIEHTKILVITGNLNSNILVEKLIKAHAIVDTLQVYKTEKTDLKNEPVAKRFRREGADAIIFASSSSVESFISQVDYLQLEPKATKPLTCSIGPVTSEAMRKHNISVDVEAKKPNIKSLVQTLLKQFSR
jgi:uroporphyrinogen III methyltransferase / synthase